MSKEAKTKTGTREWAGDTVNFQIGCPNGCRYCYARYNAVEGRFKYCKPNEWNEPRINHKKVDKNYGKYKDGVMIPSTHDITDENVNECIIVIKSLLRASNKVLIVSKPRWSCVPLICEALKASFHLEFLMRKVTFRFTIGSTDSDVLKFWEPNAPNFKERYSCLQYAYNAGFDTSISCEPFLDQFPCYVYEATEALVTDKIWVGMLREFDKRCRLDGIKHSEFYRFVRPLKELQSPAMVKAMYGAMKHLPKIEWKDSVRKVVGI